VEDCVKKLLPSLCIFALLFCLLLCSPAPAPAQEVSAAITGAVTDSSGAPLAGATATATDVDRGTNWSSVTNESGVYNILRLPVGTYTLKIEAQGFETVTYPKFTLVLNQVARFDVGMKVGAITTSIEVVGELPILQTQSTEVSTLFDATTTTTLPLAARNYVQLALLSPGATTVNPSSISQPQLMTGAGRPDINGNREQAVGFLLDGIINQEAKNNEVAYMPNVDAIEEFNVITQNAGADFGNYAGGVVSVSIKSGTNSFHGDAFEFFRNDYLNSNVKSSSWATGTAQPKPALRYNMFGGTFGGPIKKDKLFFFADYQGMRIPTHGPTNAQVMTQAERNGDFGGLCTDAGGTFNAIGDCSKASGQLYDPASAGGGPKVGVPYNPKPIPFNNLVSYYGAAAENPFAKALFADTKDYPLPLINSAVGNNFSYNTGNNFNSDQGDLRIDYKMSDTDVIYGRFSKMDTSQSVFSSAPFLNPGAAQGTDEPGWSAVVAWSHSFGSSVLNQARLGTNVFRFNQNETPTTSLGNVSESLGIPGANSQAPGLLQISMSGGGGVSASLGLINLWQIFRDTEIQAQDDLSVTHGRHTYRVGFQWNRERNNYVYPGNEGALGNININNLLSTQPCTPTAAVSCAAFSNVADFWLGSTAGGGFRDSGSTALEQLRGSIWAGYVQDDWRATSTLTLNLGLRFEDHTPFYEEHNRVVNFGYLDGAILTSPPQVGGYGGRALYNNYLGIGDWNPRIGLAWSPAMLGGKTVIRAAYGSSSYREGGGSNEELSLNLPFGNVLSTYPTGIGSLTDGWPAPPTPCTTIELSCYAGQRLRVYPSNFRPASIQQWNLTLEHQFRGGLTLQAGYVGQHGTHLLNFEDLAQWKGLNAQGTVALPGQVITQIVPGPYLGSSLPGANAKNNLGWAEAAPYLTGTGASTTAALVGANMSNSNQTYNALQMVLKERGYHGLQGQLAYTYSKCLSNSPGYFGTGWGSTQAQSSGGQPGWGNIYDPKAYWGPCYYDETHIFSGYFSYQLPFGRGKQFGTDASKALNAVIGDWQLSGIVTLHSGNALTVNQFGGWGAYPTASNPDLTGGIGPYTLSDLPNCNGPIKVTDQFVPYNAQNHIPAHIQWFDTSNISNPAPNTFGTCSVGNVRGPWLKTLDLSLQKEFHVTENKLFQLRLDAFNAFNSSIWTFSGGPANGSFDQGQASNGVNTQGSLGWITGTQSARQLQIALKFLF
jgi:hypothetical protein